MSTVPVRAAPRRSAGFTLLEMVMAVGIFSIVAVIAYGGLTRFLDSYTHLSAREQRLKEVQSTFSQFERDLRYLAARPVRDEYGDEEAAFISRSDDPPVPGEIMRLSVYMPDGRITQISDVQRVAWRYDDEKLYRVSWKVLDRAQDSTEYLRQMLDGVREVNVRFMTADAGGEVVASDDWSVGETAPSGVEVVIVLEGGERYRRVFEVYDGA
jgi:general secretion pathway protein J